MWKKGGVRKLEVHTCDVRAMMGEGVEARFARKLANNDLRTRSKALRSLKKWMTARSAVEDAFTELEMLKLWRGLYMCMWHSDKPLVQEELAESLASFIHVLLGKDVVFLFVRSFFSIMSREWLNIDRLRLDKFYMLIRRMIRHSFQYLLDNEWDSSLVDSFVQLLSEGPLNADLSKTCSGVQLHVVEVYLPELLAVCANSVPAECSLCLLQPCCHLLANTRDPVTAQVVEASVLGQLVVGKKAEKLKVDVCALSERLLQLAVSRDTLGRNRKTLYTLRKRLQEFATDRALSGEAETGIESEGLEGVGGEDREMEVEDEDGIEEGGGGEDRGGGEERGGDEEEGGAKERGGDEEGGGMESEEGETEKGEMYRAKRRKTGVGRKKKKKHWKPGVVMSEAEVVGEGVCGGEEVEEGVCGGDEAGECAHPRGKRRRHQTRGVRQKKLNQQELEEDRGEEREVVTSRVKQPKTKDDCRDRKDLLSNQSTPSHPKKRVSFLLHKNKIFTP